MLSPCLPKSCPIIKEPQKNSYWNVKYLKTFNLGRLSGLSVAKSRQATEGSAAHGSHHYYDVWLTSARFYWECFLKLWLMLSPRIFNISVWTFQSFFWKYLVPHYLDRLAAPPQAHPLPRLSGAHLFYLHIQKEIFLNIFKRNNSEVCL